MPQGPRGLLSPPYRKLPPESPSGTQAHGPRVPSRVQPTPQPATQLVKNVTPPEPNLRQRTVGTGAVKPATPPKEPEQVGSCENDFGIAYIL
jgi:hypothetical protein